MYIKHSLILIAGLGLFFLFPNNVDARIELVKGPDTPAVYYLDEQNFRHVFPTLAVYDSWYQGDFSRVVEVSREFLQGLPLGNNITIRPGTKLVKIQTSPEVYAVEPGGVLRHITDEAFAERIWGDKWNQRVIDVPDVFFTNYLIGPPIDADWKLPDGIVYKIKNGEKIYYKRGGVLQAFDSQQAILANGYKLTDVAEGTVTFFTRLTAIKGQQANIFDPVAPPRVSTADCANSDLRAAMILVTKANYSQADVDKLNILKENLVNQFAWATDNLSTISIDTTLNIFQDNSSLTLDSGELNRNEIGFTFYENNNDVFDFLIVFTDFNTITDHIANFTPINNHVLGMGKPSLLTASLYGSSGKLKGLINMDNIRKDDYKISTQAELDSTTNFIIHEILHNWSGATHFIDENGLENAGLLLADGVHWSNFAGFISPLGGAGFQANGDGTFTSQLALGDFTRKKMTNLDLYLMGLIQPRFVEPVTYVEVADPLVTSPIISGTEKPVTIDQIISAEGPWVCTLEN
jgi:hypothetical protein